MASIAEQVGRSGLRGYWARQLTSPAALATYAFIAAVLATILATGNAYLLNALNELMLWIGLAASLNIIMGFAGYVSFGHVVFMGIGGYVLAWLMQYGAPELAARSPLAAATLSMLLAAAAAAAVAGSIGAAVLRLRGAFFAIATIGLDLTAAYLAEMIPTEEGGGEIYLSASLAPGIKTLTLVIWLLGSVALLAQLLVKKSRLGAGLEAVREDEDAAAALGVPTARYKTIAFMISAALAAMLGAAYAWKTANVTPGDAFDLKYSIRMIVIDVIGGLGTLLGPIVGGALYYLTYLYLTTSSATLSNAADIILGVVAILMVLFLPRGIIGTLRLRSRRLARLLE